ncbi:vWA domain-containing protein [Deinococcus aquaedulcis]|uniref:vWA domain-containing protein n=1 Tax=Deinococcus aquaedulcis TaxID=2840455 RepID=UPI001C833AD9|nr:VWA domain-containing protein [Deinococcus aquaedulcis]
MTTPSPELRALRPALPAGQTTHLTLLIRVHPAPVPIHAAWRPPLNLALVIDRSGSMGGHPLHMARQAAGAAVRQMGLNDQVSVVAFDDEVRVVVPSQPVTDPAGIIRAMDTIEAGGMTNLHGGWLEGATQVAAHLDPQALNRVVLLSACAR